MAPGTVPGKRNACRRMDTVHITSVSLGSRGLQVYRPAGEEHQPRCFSVLPWAAARDDLCASCMRWRRKPDTRRDWMRLEDIQNYTRRSHFRRAHTYRYVFTKTTHDGNVAHKKRIPTPTLLVQDHVRPLRQELGLCVRRDDRLSDDVPGQHQTIRRR